MGATHVENPTGGASHHGPARVFLAEAVDDRDPVARANCVVEASGRLRRYPSRHASQGGCQSNPWRTRAAGVREYVLKLFLQLLGGGDLVHATLG